MSRKLLQWMTLAFLLSGCTSGEDFGYIVYKGENHISETESFLIYVFLQNFEQSAQKEQWGHVQFYAKQLEGNINYPITYYCSGTGSISIYKDGALYMTGSFSGTDHTPPLMQLLLDRCSRFGMNMLFLWAGVTEFSWSGIKKIGKFE